jgi:hypothetical protein
LYDLLLRALVKLKLQSWSDFRYIIMCLILIFWGTVLKLVACRPHSFTFVNGVICLKWRGTAMLQTPDLWRTDISWIDLILYVQCNNNIYSLFPSCCCVTMNGCYTLKVISPFLFYYWVTI